MNEEFKQQLWQTTLPHMNIRKCSKQFSNTQIFKYQPQVVKIKAFLKLMSLYIYFISGLLFQLQFPIPAAKLFVFIPQP